LLAGGAIYVAVSLAPFACGRRASSPTQLPTAAAHHDRAAAARTQRRPTVARTLSAVVRRLQRRLLAPLHDLTIHGVQRCFRACIVKCIEALDCHNGTFSSFYRLFAVIVFLSKFIFRSFSVPCGLRTCKNSARSISVGRKS